MKFSIIQISGIIAAFQLFIVGFYFIHAHPKKASNNIILAILLFSYAIMIVCSLILSSGMDRRLFSFAHLGNQVSFLIGPLLYFHIKSPLDSNFTLAKSSVTHIIPFMAVTIYLAIKFYFKPVPITCRFNHILIGSLAFIHTFIYVIFSLRVLKQNGVSINQMFKPGKESSATLLYVFIIGCSYMWLIKLLFFTVWDVSGYYQGCNEIVNLHFLVSFILFNALLYILLIKPQYFFMDKKYKYSLLTTVEKQKCKQKLVSNMELERPYLDPLLTLKKLARYIEIPERHLSQVINESFDKNFYDFINTFRIQEAMNYLADLQHTDKTILYIAYEVGFNSKSTFNTAFRKYTGDTPSAYRRKLITAGVAQL